MEGFSRVCGGGLTGWFWKRRGEMSRPSSVTPGGRAAPATWAKVGKISTVAAILTVCVCVCVCLFVFAFVCVCTSGVRPGVILPGHQAMAGTLCPPSHVVPFPHLRGPALPPRISLARDGLCVCVLVCALVLVCVC